MTPKKIAEVLAAHKALMEAQTAQGQARRAMEAYLSGTPLSRQAQDKIISVVELDFAEQVRQALAVCEAL
jgi:hypothetical protein